MTLLPALDVPAWATCTCGRKLVDPTSVSRRRGPVCWAKEHPAQARRTRRPGARRRAVMAAPAPRRNPPADGQLALDLTDHITEGA